MAWFFRAIELSDGRWACRHGQRVFDVHAELDAAIQHATELARRSSPAEVIVHWLAGRVEHLGPVET